MTGDQPVLQQEAFFLASGVASVTLIAVPVLGACEGWRRALVSEEHVQETAAYWPVLQTPLPP